MSNTVAGLLDGKSTLVIGASQGIGAAAVRHFATQGARLVIGARNVEALEALRDELRGHGHEVDAIRIDVTDRATIDAAVQHTRSLHGRLDAAFNNAGGSVMEPFHEYSEKVYDQQLDVNLKGVFLAMQAEIKAMLADGGGAIVNTSGVGGLVGNYGMAPYIAAKHGVIGLTKAAAFEYGQQNVRVNAVAPDSIASEAFLAAVEHAPAEVVAKFNSFSPMNRVGQPLEVATAAAWLLSDQAGFVTGTTLPVDGGFVLA